MKTSCLILLTTVVVPFVFNIKVVAQQTNQEPVVALKLPGMDTLSLKMGFKTPRLTDPKEWNKKVPILFVRAGLDNVPYLNQAFKNFYAKALDQNLPITVINYSNGLHAFDLYNNNDTTRQIINTTLDFWKFNLHVK